MMMPAAAALLLLVVELDTVVYIACLAFLEPQQP